MDARRQRSRRPRAGLPDDTIGVLLSELATDLGQKRTQICAEWAQRIIETRLLTSSLVDQEIAALTAALCRNLTRVLETGSSPLLVACADNLYERLSPRGVEAHEVLGAVLLLRDLLARSLFVMYHMKYQENFGTVRRPILSSAPLESFELSDRGPGRWRSLPDRAVNGVSG